MCPNCGSERIYWYDYPAGLMFCADCGEWIWVDYPCACEDEEEEEEDDSED